MEYTCVYRSDRVPRNQGGVGGWVRGQSSEVEVGELFGQALNKYIRATFVRSPYKIPLLV